MLEIPDIRSLQQHPLTWIVIALCALGYGVFLSLGASAITTWLMPRSFSDMQHTFSYWTFISPIFIHFTALHLVVNAYTFWLFAAKVEGRSRYELLLLIIISAAVSNGAQWWATDGNFGGLSGVVYALLGYCGIRSLVGRQSAYQSPTELNVVMLLLIPVAATGMFGSFANIAHISGLFSGAALGFIRLHASKILEQRLSNDQ